MGNDSSLPMEMCSNFDADEIRRLGKRFSKLDLDNSGALSVDEFMSISELQQNPLVQRVIDIFDADGNGEVDFKEFIQGVSQFSVKGDKLSKLRFAFRIYDMDNDGFISNGELFQVLKMMVGSNLKDTQLQQIVDKTIVFADKDEDGCGNLELLNQLDLIGRTCELAKLFGIQFYEVLSSGSQYRVESMMLRIAKPRNIISVSPSVQQRAHMKAPEYLPLILEPHSRLYSDPLIVLDFQSLIYCSFQTKKRYVGFMYESADQQEPVYEAKGIETVRRDGCPAVAKMLEKTLKLLFETLAVSVVKKYICRQFTKILSGRANIQDLILAKEFRGIDGYKPNACVPALELTRKWKQVDRRAEPRRGERVPYLVINGPPGVPLIRLIRSPHEYLADEGLKINTTYYITKVIIPPLNRCLLLIGADVNQWFSDLPRTSKAMTVTSTAATIITKNSTKKSTISQYFSATSCVTDCGEQTQNGICANCQRRPHQSAVILSLKIAQLERKYCMTQSLCESCCGRSYQIDCSSLDCPVLFLRNAWKRDNKQVEYFRELLERQFS